MNNNGRRYIRETADVTNLYVSSNVSVCTGLQRTAPATQQQQQQQQPEEIYIHAQHISDAPSILHNGEANQLKSHC
jgi:hypothetical protein